MAKKRLKPDERHALLSWDDTLRSIRNASAINSRDTYAEIEARKKRLEADDEAWFKYYFEKYYKCDPAPFHVKATKRLTTNKRWYEVRAWARELAKSARSMMEVTKMALTGDVKNVLLISNSQDNAIRLLNPIRANLEANRRIIQDYGEQQKFGSWEEKEFTTLGGVAFRAIGAAGMSPRGTRSDDVRPDFILIDDIDTDEETRNPERIKEKWNWLESALVPTMSMSNNYRILFNGNIIAKDSIITRAIDKANELKKRGIGHVDIINIRDKNGKSTWAAKNSEEDIDTFLSLISTAAAQKEFYNNPLSEGDVFTEIRWGRVPPLNRFRFLIAYGDPAPSNSKNKSGSYKSVFLVGFHEGKYYIITGFLDHVTNDEFTQWYYSTRDFVKDRTQVYNYIENNKLQNPFYEQVFKPLFNERAKEQGYIGVIPDERAKPDKFSRIEGNLEPLNRDGRLIFNEAEKDNPHMKRLEEQFLLINPQLKAPADGPDCVEGAVWIINEKLTAVQPDSVIIGRRTGTRKY